MSDDAIAPETGKETPTAPAAGNGSTPSGGGRSIEDFSPEAQDYIKRLRGESASHRNELKAEREKREALEEAGKTEQQKREDALKAAEAKVADSDLKLLRFEVAAEEDLPLKLAGRLQGSTKEELKADAVAMKKEFGLDGEGGTPAGGGFDGGVRKPVVKPNSMNEMIRRAAGRT